VARIEIRIPGQKLPDPLRCAAGRRRRGTRKTSRSLPFTAVADLSEYRKRFQNYDNVLFAGLQAKKAMALELYAKQARNTGAERKASEVGLRAERRVGELLKELARATPEDRSPGRPKSRERRRNSRP